MGDIPKSDFPCSGCGKTIKPFYGRKTTTCLDCARVNNGRHPDKIAKCRAVMLEHMQDPSFKAQALERAQAGLRKKRRTDPAFRARMRQLGREMAATGAGHAAQPKGSEPRRRAAENRSQSLLAWCPVEYREEYRRLVYTKRLGPGGARAVIEEQIAKDAERYARTGKLQQSVRE